MMNPVTTRTQQRTTPRRVLPFLAALVAVLATLLSSASASAATTAGAETRVRASQSVAEDIARPPEYIDAGQRLGNEVAGPGIVVATGVAAKGADDGVQLFRHAGPDELADLKATGTFNLGPNSTGKYFADNAEHATKWGAWLNGGQGGVVSTTVPRSFAEQMMRWEKLDDIGPARFASPEQLDRLNGVMSGVRFR